MSTEKTPLTDSGARAALNYSYYGNDNGVQHFYTRRRKEQQLQCITFVIVIAIFIMALVVTVSYSINEVEDPLVANTTNPEEIPASPTLKAAWNPELFNLENLKQVSPTSLTIEEWNNAVKAGKEAIAIREIADGMAIPLPAPSPNSRHQYAVKTSLQAGKLALAAVGELAATRNVEKARALLGSPSSIGSYFKNIWLPDGTCKEYLKIDCSPSKYRNFDGTCNHPKNFGSALTPFIRNLPADYSDGVEAPRTGKFGKLPSAREVSLKIHPPAPSSNPSFTVMLAVFGQFLDHDITATAVSQGKNGSSVSCCPATIERHPECFPVQVGPGDPVYDFTGRDCMEFVRSAPAPQCKIGPRQQINQVTAFIDGSVIYGPDIETSRNLRLGQGGLLRMFKTPDNRTLLPQSTDPNDGCNRIVESSRGRYCFASGDGRANENLHLTTMHLLWARQHNRIAEGLSELNPTWSDERIYQESRRIIGAQLQHVAYNEFIPVVLGEKEVNDRKLKPLPLGFRPKNNSAEVNPAIANSFAAAAFRFAHTLLPGLMKVTDSNKGTSSYVELHRMLFNPYSLYLKGGMESSLTTATSNTIQKTTTHVTSQLTKHLFEDPLSNVSIPCGLDLVSLNIQRGRDHGLPGYTVWRQYCGLGKVSSFEDLREELDPNSLDQLSKLYDHVEDIDLYTGALSEINKGDGLVGPTFTCLIADQFTRTQQGDRFWYEVPGEPHSFTEGQLKEIRKSSLAKLICDCSDEIDQVQPKVMRSVSFENPMTICEDIPGLDLAAWKDASLPVLTAAVPGEIPETWLNFKDEINKTVQEIVDFFGKSPPVPGSSEWATFHDWVNKSFADIKNEVSALHPKAVETVGNAPLNLEAKSGNYKGFNEFPESDSNKNEEGFKKDTGKFNYMQFVMNRSLSDLNKYSKTATTQPTIYEDWINFKTDIKKLLNDALINVTGTPTKDQREELKKRISDEIAVIKGEIASVKIAKFRLTKEATIEDSAAAADWANLKNDVIKAVTDAVDRIKDSAPPPGDSAWATFGPEIKKQFSTIKDYIPVLPTEKLMAKDPSTVAYWDNFKSSLNKSITDIVSDINANMPAPGDPAWHDFRTEIKDEFSNFKNNSMLQSTNSIAQLAKELSTKKLEAKEPSIEAFWTEFKSSLNKSINDAVAEVAGKNLSHDDPAWSAIGTKVMTNFYGFKNKFAGLKDNTVSQLKSAKDKTVKESSAKELKPKDPAIAAFWNDFRISLNNSINNSIAEIAGKNLPPGDPAWAAIGTKIMNKFAVFQDKFIAENDKSDGKYFANSKIKASAPGKDIPFDWVSFKSEITNSVIETVERIKKNAPPPGSPAWIAFKGQILNGFAKIPSEIALQKLGFIGESDKGLNPSTKGSFDWMSLKNEINKSVSEIVDKKYISSMFPPGDPRWAEVGAKFSRLNQTFQVVKSEIDSLRPKPEESQFSVLKKDWTDFKNDINKSLDDARDFINSNAPPPGDPGWISFRDSIKDEFAALRNEIDFVKSEASLDVPQKIIVSLSNEKLKKSEEYIQNLPDFSSDLFSLQERMNKTLLQLKNNIVSMKLGATAPVISAVDWIGFKQEIKNAVTDFVKAFNGTEAEEWKEMKDSVKKSFAELRNEIILLRNETIASQKKLVATNQKIDKNLQEKQANNLTKDTNISKNTETIFDWNKFKTDINSTIHNLFNDLANVVPEKTPSKSLKESLVTAQNKIANLQVSSALMAQNQLPEDWTIFVNGINKTLTSLVKKINGLKPIDKTDSVASQAYEEAVNAFFEEVKQVVDNKKKEFAFAKSTSSSLLKSSAIFSSTLVMETAFVFTWFAVVS